MRFLRPPFLFLIAWTLLCVVPVLLVVPAVTVVPAPGTCFEWCDLGRLLGNGVIRLMTFVWVVVTLIAVAVWTSRAGSPERRSRSRDLAGVAAILIGPVSGGSLALAAVGDYEHFADLSVVASALQLIAATEIAKWTRPPALATTALLVMGAAAVVPAAALVIGADLFNVFWQVLPYASDAAAVALLVLIARATTRPIPGRSALVVIVVCELSSLVLYTLFVLRLDALRFLLVAGGPVVSVVALAAWVWFGVATLRASEALPPSAGPDAANPWGAPMAVQRPRTPPPYPRF